MSSSSAPVAAVAAPAMVRPPRASRFRPRPSEAMRAADAGSPMLLVSRVIHPDVAWALDALPLEALPRFAGEGRAADAGRLCRAAASARRLGPGWLANWLAEDIVEQAGLLAMVTRAPRLRFRLEVLLDGAAPDVPGAVHLVTAYRGAGPTRRLGRGDVAIFHADRAPPRPASASIAGLLFTVEAVARR